jgi:hypothetical protein
MSTKAIGLPDPLASDEEKLSKDYGLNICAVIESEWFGGGLIAKGCEFMNRRDYVEEKRLFVRGENDTDEDKKHMSRGDYDLNYLNLDWEKVNVPEKFCNIVSNGIQDESYRLDISSFDRYAVMQKQERLIQLKRDMMAKPMLEKAKQLHGIDLTPKGFVPEDDEELMIHLEINERPKIEIAEEIMINYVKRISDWTFIEEQKNRDLVQLGLAVCRVYTDRNNGVVVEYVDPENFGHSFTKKNNFSDAYYFFVVDTITITDLKRESDFDEKILRKIAKSYATRNNAYTELNFMECPFEDLVNIKVDVMRFAFKSTKTIAYKKTMKEGKIIKASKKKSDFEPPAHPDFGKMSKTLDTWYEGNYVIGLQELYGYKECENLVRDEMNRVRPPFIARATNIYKNKLRSFLGNIQPICRQLQREHLKIQQLVAELKPDLIKLDLDQLAELDDGKGPEKKENWKVAMSLLNVKGVVITERIDMGEEGMKDGAGASPVANAQGSALAPLLNTWAFYYNLIRDITGVNPARDGSLSEDALVGVNQLAQLASNTATKHIVDAAVAFNLNVAEVTSSRIHSIFKYKEASHLRKLYETAVGKENVDALEALADRDLHEFGFSAEMLPTKKLLDEFREDLNLALQDGTIDVEDKIEAQAIALRSFKYAREFLKYRRRKRIKQRMQEQMTLAADKSKNDQEAAAAATRNKVEAYSMEKEIDLEYEAKLSQIRLAEKEAMLQIEAPTEQEKFQQEVYLEQVKSMTLLDRDRFKEEAKDLRQDKVATQNSKMIEQRRADTGAIDFENDFNIADLFTND